MQLIKYPESACSSVCLSVCSSVCRANDINIQSVGQCGHHQLTNKHAFSVTDVMLTMRPADIVSTWISHFNSKINWRLQLLLNWLIHSIEIRRKVWEQAKRRINSIETPAKWTQVCSMNRFPAALVVYCHNGKTVSRIINLGNRAYASPIFT